MVRRTAKTIRIKIIHQNQRNRIKHEILNVSKGKSGWVGDNSG